MHRARLPAVGSADLGDFWRACSAVGSQLDRVAWRSGITSISVAPSQAPRRPRRGAHLRRVRTGCAAAGLDGRRCGSASRCAWPSVAGIEGQRYALAGLLLARENGAMGVAWDETPSYLRLGTDELAARARQALALLGTERCGVCPRLCKVDRLADHKGLCAIGRQAVVASYSRTLGRRTACGAGTARGRSFSPAATCAVGSARTTTSPGRSEGSG
jgi:hypothetical protein